MSDPFVRLSRSDLQSVQEAALNLAEASSRLAAELTDILCGGYWINEAENDKLRIFLQFRALEDGPPPTPQFLLDLLESVGVHNDTDRQDWARVLGRFLGCCFIECRDSIQGCAYWVVLRRGDWEEPSLFESAGGPLRPAIP